MFKINISILLILRNLRVNSSNLKNTLIEISYQSSLNLKNTLIEISYQSSLNLKTALV